jgi:hypothetical protein
VAPDEDGIFKGCDLNLSHRGQLAFLAFVLVACALAALGVNGLL